MDELQILVNMVAKLPNMALWVLVGFLVYKLALVGSVYGTIKFAIDKWHSYATNPDRKTQVVQVRPILDGITIRTELDYLVSQIHRIRGKGLTVDSEYIHQASVDWLRKAIDAQELADRTEKGEL